MSHIWAARVAYVLGILLLGAVTLFAWAQGVKLKTSPPKTSIETAPTRLPNQAQPWSG